MIGPNAPAYPHTHGTLDSRPGLTIRAEFAKAAMQGMVHNLSVSTEHDQSATMKRIADLAWAQADALIAGEAK